MTTKEGIAWRRGIVKFVLSGDTLIIQEILPESKPNINNTIPEKQITFSALTAPRLGRPKKDDKEATPDEPFAWESREFLRKQAVGKKVVFFVEYVNAANGKEYGTVALFETNEVLNRLVLSEGWASVFKSPTGKESRRPDLPELMQLEEAAQTAGKGIHGHKSNARKVPTFEPFSLYTQLKGKPLNAVVEQARTGTTLRLTLLPSLHNLVVILSGAQAPNFKRDEPEPFAKDARQLVEQNTLQRDVILTIEGVDKQGNLFGSIETQGRDVAEELLKGGFATYVAWSANLRGADWSSKLKAAEKAAKDSKKRIWTNYVEKADSAHHNSPKGFAGKVTSILNAGTITVETQGLPDQTVNLSSIKVPRMPYPGEEEEESGFSPQVKEELRAEKAWALEAKEFLRRRLIHQKVKVVFDYIRKTVKKEGTELHEKSFYSVYLNDVNIAILLAEQGFVKVMEYRAGDDRTQEYELLLVAENKAKAAGKGWHGPPEKAPAKRINDLTIEPRDAKAKQAHVVKAKSFLAFLQRQKNNKALVDYVFSGGRFKLSIPAQSCVIILSLSGVKVPKRGESPENDAISNEALQWSRKKLHQREVTIEVDGVDKGGNFVGQVFLSKDTNFAAQLLQEGFASVHAPSADRMREREQFIEAENKAKQNRKNIWHNYDPEEEKRKQQLLAEGEAVTTSTEFLDVFVTEVTRGDRFYVQIINAESASLDELVGRLTTLSLEEGPVPEINVKVGEVVRAQFTEDDSWYRAKVIQSFPDHRYKVLFLDYGNSEIIDSDRIRALPREFIPLPFQAQEAGLAFLKAPSLESDWGRESYQALKELTTGKRLMASVEYREAGILFLGLADQGGIHINAAMVRAGVARVSHKRRRHSSEHPLEEERKAKANHSGIWQYGDAPDSEEDEDEPRGVWGKLSSTVKQAPGKPAATAKPAAAAAPKKK